jgi:hypothetical protein
VSARKPDYGTPQQKTTVAGRPSPPTFRLEVEAGRVVGANQAPRDKQAAWRISETWRDATFWLAKAAQLPRMGEAFVRLTVHLRAGARADQQNYVSGPSCKGLLDGLVRAGVMVDDREPYATVSCRTTALEGGRPRVVVELRPKAPFPGRPGVSEPRFGLGSGSSKQTGGPLAESHAAGRDGDFPHRQGDPK